MSVQSVDTSDFVSVEVDVSPLSIQYEAFGTLMILGDSNVIDVNERYRKYSDELGIAQDFGTTSPEYLAANLFFSQAPQPNVCYVGRWASTATSGILHGAILTATQQLLSNFTAITNGSLSISIDGVVHNIVSGLNFSSALNLNGVAAILQTALRTAFGGTSIRCVWGSVNQRFDIVSGTTGTASTVSYGSTVPSLGGTTDISTLLGLTAASGASPLVLGIAAESTLNAVVAIADASSQWYGLMAATTVALQTADHEAISAFVLGSNRSRIYGVTFTNTNVLDPTNNQDLASILQSFNNKRVFGLWSTSNPYAVATMYGRAFTVNFEGNNTTITLAYKQAPGLQGEYLTETQFSTLVSKGANVNIEVNNGAVMLWPGQMCNGYWLDEVQGVDWLQNRIQTDVFNLLYETTTKIPQTDDGNNQIKNTINASCAAGVYNGLLAPGQWNASGFGQLQPGMTLTAGYYVFCPLIATQSESDRTARKSVPFQVAVKLAGAIHTVDVILNVNR